MWLVVIGGVVSNAVIVFADVFKDAAVEQRGR